VGNGWRLCLGFAYFKIVVDDVADKISGSGGFVCGHGIRGFAYGRLFERLDRKIVVLQSTVIAKFSKGSLHN